MILGLPGAVLSMIRSRAFGCSQYCDCLPADDTRRATRLMNRTHYQRSNPRLSAAANSSDFATAFVSSLLKLSLYKRF